MNKEDTVTLILERELTSYRTRYQSHKNRVADIRNTLTQAVEEMETCREYMEAIETHLRKNAARTT